MDISPLFWVAFNAGVLGLLLLDLLVFQRRARVVRLREALAWSGFWIALSLAFNYAVYRGLGPRAGIEFLTGYLIEKSLSIDNLFVFLLIFSYFKVPPQYQRKILFWGVLGALALRGLFVVAGAALLTRFYPLTYLLGAFLVYTGVRMASQAAEPDINPDNNPVVRFLGRHLPISPQLHGGRFFVRQHGVLMATPLLVVLVMVESTDIVFAADSIPAILAVSRDTFIVYTSNVFALLGLRALYFALEGVMRLFHYLHYGLSLILVFIGSKLLFENLLAQAYGFRLSMLASLGVVGGILAVSVLASLLWPKRENELHKT